MHGEGTSRVVLEAGYYDESPYNMKVRAGLTWNRESEEKMIATSKSWAVSVYVTNDKVAARTGMENAKAILNRVIEISAHTGYKNANSLR